MDDRAAAPAHLPATTGSLRLRAAVLASDTIALALGWALAVAAIDTVLMSVTPGDAWAGLAASVGVGLLGLRATGAHERRIVRVRRRELAATSRAALAPAGLMVVLLPQDAVLTTLAVATAAGLGWALLLAASRAAVGEWIRGHRARGHLHAPVLVVGTGRARELADFLDSHPHLGFTVADTVEMIPDAADDAVRMLAGLARTTGASGVVVSDPGDPVVRPLLAALGQVGLHVHVATGVQGLELGSAVTSSLAGELFLDFGPRRTPAWERAAIRAVDVTVAALGLLLTLPVWLVVAVAIKLTDGGPMLFVQQRVGLGGRPFAMLKFRSMREGAQDMVLEAVGNGREGPLTKVADDPRITTVGRFIRATSLDELPQLVNVLRGEMSVVGPRPALPDEHEQFDDELRRRTLVRPGLTGLWQVEGRDLPSFDLYRRLDLLYVDNVSLRLHLSVLLRTVTALVGHTLRSLLGGSEATLAPATRGGGHDDLIEVPEAQPGGVRSREASAAE